MIGIDIVDLNDPLLKSRENSLRLISHPQDKIKHNTSFWHLWCSKEAVFKVHRNIQPFSPTYIPILFSSNSNFHSDEVKGSVSPSNNYVCSIASTKENYHYEIFECETSNPSLEIRTLIKQWFKNTHITTSVVKDVHGLPMLSHNQSPISISHHGKYLAFAYLTD